MAAKAKRQLPRCGARTRAGPPCKAPPWRARGAFLPRNGRCRMHGGLSTGPRSPEGKARCRAAALRNLESARAAGRAVSNGRLLSFWIFPLQHEPAEQRTLRELGARAESSSARRTRAERRPNTALAPSMGLARVGCSIRRDERRTGCSTRRNEGSRPTNWGFLPMSVVHDFGTQASACRCTIVSALREDTCGPMERLLSSSV
jgi:hypothetical protein